tara:strand:- start:3658 stop:3798 length:141 start_codon:yes stop_codon:yes gene_type:complete
MVVTQNGKFLRSYWMKGNDKPELGYAFTRLCDPPMIFTIERVVEIE